MSQLDITEQATTKATVNHLDRIILSIASRFGDKAKEVERFIKFVFVGVMGAVVDFSTVFILQATILAPAAPYQEAKVILATTIAFLAAILNNFTWNRYWTYPDSRSRSIRRQLTQFAFVNFVGWSGRTLWITLAFLPIGTALTPAFEDLARSVSPEYVADAEATAKLGTMVAQFIGLWVVMLWNFFVNRYWTYNDVD